MDDVPVRRTRFMPKRGTFTNLNTTAVKNTLLVDEVVLATDRLQFYRFDGDDLNPVTGISPDVPANASATGTAGQLAYDSDYIYVCIAEDSWRRVAISSWQRVFFIVIMV